MFDARLSDLPSLPPRGWGDGYDWMESLPRRWKAVAGWGKEGWDLGSWPYVIVCTCVELLDYNDPRRPLMDRVYGVATYCEGDIEVAAYASHEERIRALDNIAAFYWRLAGEMPGVPPIGPLAEEYTGPFSWERLGVTTA